MQRASCAPASSMTGRATLSHTACACRAPPKGFKNTSRERGRSAHLRIEACTAAVQSAAPSPCCGREHLRLSHFAAGLNAKVPWHVRCHSGPMSNVTGFEHELAKGATRDMITRVWNLSVLERQMYGLLGRRSKVWISMQCICSDAVTV